MNELDNNVKSEGGSPSSDPYYEAFKPETEEKYPVKRSDVLFAIFTFVLAVFGVSAVFWGKLRLGYTLFFDVSLVGLSVYLAGKDTKIRPCPAACGIMSLVCSWSFAVTSNSAVRFCAFAASAAGGLVWLANVSGKTAPRGDYSTVSTAVGPFFKGIGSAPAAARSLFSSDKAKSKTALRILAGVFFALPLMLIAAALLGNSDEAFSFLLKTLRRDLGSTFGKIALGAAVSPFLIGYAFYLKFGKADHTEKERPEGVNTASVSAFLGALSSVYLVYLFSQLAYFFSAFSGILPAGYKFTYSEYARRGFFELCVIAGINLVTLLIAVAVSRKDEGRIPVPVRAIGTFISVFTLIVIATSLAKMALYIKEYGMTLLRLLPSAFMVWMICVFISLTVRLFKKRHDVTSSALLFALVIISVLGIGNVNAFTAKYNYEHFGEEKILDTNYLYQLGDEGIPYLVKAAESKDAEVSEKAQRLLSGKLLAYYEEDQLALPKGSLPSALTRKYRGWNSFSFSRDAAYKSVESYLSRGGKLK